MLANLRFFIFLQIGIILFLGLLIIVGVNNILLIKAYIFIVTFLLIQFSFTVSLLSPSFLFVLSVFIFIWMRPFLFLFDYGELIYAGYPPTFEKLVNTYIYIGYSVSIIIGTYFIFGRIARKTTNSLVNKPKLFISHYFTKSILCFGIFFGLLFYSYQKASLIGLLSYLDLASSSEFHKHFKYFFYAKFLFLIYIIFSKFSEKKFLLISIITFVFSIGFILVGMRGYTISYFFLALFFVGIFYKINMKLFVVLSVLLLLVAGITMEYRLGYSLYSGYGDMFVKTFESQGASFEVVYGAVNYMDSIRRCISVESYFKGESFGNCVDTARGVYFAEGGGFASSFFAEIYYFSIPIALILLVILGFIIRSLDTMYMKIKNNKQNDSNFYLFIYMFLLIPSLVFFARSSCLDLISKFFVLYGLLYILMNLHKITQRKSY